MLLGGSGNTGWGLVLRDLLVTGDVLRVVIAPGLVLTPFRPSVCLSCEVSKFVLTQSKKSLKGGLVNSVGAQ